MANILLWAYNTHILDKGHMCVGWTAHALFGFLNMPGLCSYQGSVNASLCLGHDSLVQLRHPVNIVLRLCKLVFHQQWVHMLLRCRTCVAQPVDLATLQQQCNTTSTRGLRLTVLHASADKHVAWNMHTHF